MIGLSMMETTNIVRGTRFLCEYLQSNLYNRLGILGPLHKLSIAITGRCNSRCITCDVWKNRPDKSKDLTLEDFEPLVTSKMGRNAHSVLLTGGEPFLNSDIEQIIKIFSESTRAKISIISNGLLSGKIISLMRKVREKKFRVDKVTLSLNGKPDTHDKTRGVIGGYNKVIETVNGMRDLGFYTSLIFTITNENYNQIEWTYDLAKQLDSEINFYPEVNSYRFGNQDGNRVLTAEHKKAVVKQLEGIFQNRKYYYFDDSTLYYTLKTFQNEQVCNCYAGLQSAFINWDGEVYPCEAFRDNKFSFGNIKQASLDAIWRSAKADKVRRYIRKGKCQPCFLSCEILPSLRKEVLHMMAYTINRRLLKQRP
jgi:radical SAM protein with 4Fe4S-binding SPASM domain